MRKVNSNKKEKANPNKYLFLVILGILLVLPTLTYAHSSTILDIDLDFDLEAKKNIITIAQEYLNTTKQAIGFNYERELIIVKFNNYPFISVAVNAFDYTVFGMEDTSKTAKSGSTTSTFEQRKAIAQTIFEKIPQSYQEELKYGEERTEKNLFTHTWYRYKDGLVVPIERLEVVIDGRNGKVIRWKLQIFLVQKELLETEPAISSELAEEIIELSFSASSLNFTPVLIIHESSPVWVTKMKLFYPIYLGVSAVDGEILFTGSMKGVLPNKYFGGKDVFVVESTLVKQIYGSD